MNNLSVESKNEMAIHFSEDIRDKGNLSIADQK